MPKEPLMEKDFNKILKNCDNEFEKQTILILRYTGMHISVLCKLDKECIKGKYIQWYRPKTGKLVRIPMHPKIKNIVKKFIESREYNYREYYWALVKNIGKRSGFPELSPMTFRHTFGVSLLDQGYSMTQVQKMMGVTNLGVITRYTQYSDKQMEDIWKRTGWLNGEKKNKK